jgi:hypothetical protein
MNESSKEEKLKKYGNLVDVLVELHDIKQKLIDMGENELAKKLSSAQWDVAVRVRKLREIQ